MQRFRLNVLSILNKSLSVQLTANAGKRSKPSYRPMLEMNIFDFYFKWTQTIFEWLEYS